MQRLFGSRRWGIHQEPKGRSVSVIRHPHCVSCALTVASLLVLSDSSRTIYHTVMQQCPWDREFSLPLGLFWVKKPFTDARLADLPSSCIGQNWTKCLILNQWQARGLKAVLKWNGCWGNEHKICFSLKTHSRQTEELIKPMMLIFLLQCWLNCHY